MASSEHDWAGPRGLRIATAASFVPAFPLGLAHGIISHQAVPAAGLVPLAVSAAAGIHLASASSRAGAAHHPALIFGGDLVLAAALVVVLVFTWIQAPSGGDGGLSMLAAYATIPLIVNFLIHLSLALRAVYIGLALDGLLQWAAWQAVPPECPNCSHHLRPGLPSFPWFRRPEGGFTRLFVSDEENRYRDDDGEEPRTDQPEAVQVSTKDKKGKSTPAVGEPVVWD